MALKHLLVHLDDTPASTARLEAALSLAAACTAEVAALCLVAEPFMPGRAGRHLPAEVLRDLLARSEAEADAILAAAAAAAAQRGVALTTLRAGGPLDRLPQLLARHARTTDLVLVGQADLATQGVDAAALAEAAFMDSGRPALVLPPDGAVLPARGVLVAWDGSREAARAASDAIPLLRLAERVVVLVVDAPDAAGRVGDPPGGTLVAHLRRHGIAAEARQVPRGDGGIAATLLEAAATADAQLLVMGGYGHSRLREMLLGGTTRAILEHTKLPTFLAH